MTFRKTWFEDDHKNIGANLERFLTLWNKSPDRSGKPMQNIIVVQMMKALLETLDEVPVCGKVRFENRMYTRCVFIVRGRDDKARAKFWVNFSPAPNSNAVSIHVSHHGRWRQSVCPCLNSWHSPERIKAKVRGLVLSEIKWGLADLYETLNG